MTGTRTVAMNVFMMISLSTTSSIRLCQPASRSLNSLASISSRRPDVTRDASVPAPRSNVPSYVRFIIAESSRGRGRSWS